MMYAVVAAIRKNAGFKKEGGKSMLSAFQHPWHIHREEIHGGSVILLFRPQNRVQTSKLLCHK